MTTGRVPTGHRETILAWWPYVIISGWLFATRPTVWLDDEVLHRAADWYTLPHGPLSWLLAPSGETIRLLAAILPALHIAGLVVFALPSRRPRIAGGLLAGLAVLVIDGINYGSGKIDHQGISHSLPALVALGTLAGNERFFVVSGLAVFYLQSFAGKALTGWLVLDQLALRDWLVLYRDFYGVTTALGSWLLAHAFEVLPVWKLADYLIVTIEAVIVLVWLRARVNRYVLMQALLVFHFAIFLLFRIDFTQLLLPVYWWAMRAPQAEPSDGDARWLVWGAVAVLILVGLRGEAQFVALMVVTGIAAWGDRSRFEGLLVPFEPRMWRGQGRVALLGAWAVLNLFAVGLAVAGHEPYPSFGGPIFAGSASNADCSGSCRVTIVGVDPQLAWERQSTVGDVHRAGLDSRLWVPKLVQYILVNGQAEQAGIRCLHHDFQPTAEQGKRLTAAVDAILAERRLQVDVRWSRYGKCAADARLARSPRG